jgi:hypothetical protein
LIPETLTANGYATRKHGESRSAAKVGTRQATTEYRIWEGIKNRCFRPGCKSYPNYGGRGITMCGQWLKFENFLAAIIAEIGRRPSARHTIDRIDNDGNYEPGNIRWATRHEQNLNTRKQKGKAYA